MSLSQALNQFAQNLGRYLAKNVVRPARISVETVVPFSFKWKNFSIYSLLPWVYAGLRTACIMLRLAPARIATRPDRPAQRASGAAHPIRTVADYSLWRQRERVRE